MSGANVDFNNFRFSSRPPLFYFSPVLYLVQYDPLQEFVIQHQPHYNFGPILNCGRTPQMMGSNKSTNKVLQSYMSLAGEMIFWSSMELIEERRFSWRDLAKALWVPTLEVAESRRLPLRLPLEREVAGRGRGFGVQVKTTQKFCLHDERVVDCQLLITQV
jgi:hypothetical protein